jgi:hypothetical protein
MKRSIISIMALFFVLQGVLAQKALTKEERLE